MIQNAKALVWFFKMIQHFRDKRGIWNAFYPLQPQAAAVWKLMQG